MNTKSTLILGAALLILAGCGRNTGYVIKPVPLDERLVETVVAADRGWFVSDKIAIVDVDGLLINEQQVVNFSLGENPVSLFVEKLDKAQQDSSVKAVLVRINSPGGSVTASDIMYRRLMEFRAARKSVPVIAVIEDVGASGGYYIACGADTILAHPTSITGSIGVIVQTFSLAGTLKMLGVTTKAITSGPYKDMLSPLKPPQKEEQDLAQTIVNDFYDRFVSVVRAGRPKLKPEKVKELADGRIYTGTQAFECGLVDGLVYMSEAIALAKKASRADRVQVVMYHRPLAYRANAYSSSKSQAPQVNMLNVNLPHLTDFTRPQVMYLWTGEQFKR